MRSLVVLVSGVAVIVSLGVSYAQQRPPVPYKGERMLSPILIDQPTAQILERGSFIVGVRAYPEGGLLGNISVGLTHRLNFGASFGGTNIIGAGKVKWNPDPGVHFAYRIFEESYAMPDIVIGYDSQGYGPYIDELERYTIKSRGFYAVASKNYGLPLTVGAHVGLCYSLEDKDGDRDFDVFGGLDLMLNDELSLVADYDIGMNDNNSQAVGGGKGYLNVGMRWTFAQRLYIEFAFKNILENRQDMKYANRELKIVYLEYF
ncbi:MAG: YjbH domain-containing protein [candidate division KSB1 bacterium]|nr:YjbH domain-containing protein [candidate division KSB1 bacterium]MDZ7385034.1 YjbH domain-containing protein [candidate division KSB1 bacterium]MDZ7393359.1 YjbH domain-containing protein [candidate division KSB1 bacterium]MDZ7414189.1 YjbH domain-containing protein [candidate division KSB1 bacterium]